MFSSVKEFKGEFQQRLLDTYAESVDESNIIEQYDILGKMVRDEAGKYWRETRNDVLENGKKQVIYFSMEFLIGRLLVNNMQNLGIYEVAKKGLEELGINIHELEEQESDAGLGNGGLGRLAACFLDSTASIGYPITGNTIRYEYGFFKQLLTNGKQSEVPDQWLTNGFAFEVRKPKHAVEVQFGGEQVTYQKVDGTYGLKTVNAIHVKAMPYDVSVIGYRNKVVDTLRLWSAEPSNSNLPKNTSFEDYLKDLNNIKLSGMEFVKNGKTNNNEESKESLITYVGESAIVATNNSNIKKSYKIKKDDEIYMITFLCSNLKPLYEKLKSENIKVTKPEYSKRKNILLLPCKTKFQYMYVSPFEKSNFKICFREIDTSTDLLNYQKAMIPNSAEKDITTIKEIKLYRNITHNDLVTLSKIFDNSYISSEEFSSEIYDNETFTVLISEEEKDEIHFDVRGKVFKGKEVNYLEDNEKRNITFIY